MTRIWVRIDHQVDWTTCMHWMHMTTGKKGTAIVVVSFNICRE